MIYSNVSILTTGCGHVNGI